MSAVWGQSAERGATFHRLVGVDFGEQRVACGATVNVTGTYHCDPKGDGAPAIGKVCALCERGLVADFQVGDRVQIVDDEDVSCGTVIAVEPATDGDGVRHHVRWDDGVTSYQFGRWLRADSRQATATIDRLRAEGRI